MGVPQRINTMGHSDYLFAMKFSAIDNFLSLDTSKWKIVTSHHFVFSYALFRDFKFEVFVLVE